MTTKAINDKIDTILCLFIYLVYINGVDFVCTNFLAKLIRQI